MTHATLILASPSHRTTSSNSHFPGSIADCGQQSRTPGVCYRRAARQAFVTAVPSVQPRRVKTERLAIRVRRSRPTTWKGGCQVKIAGNVFATSSTKRRTRGLGFETKEQLNDAILKALGDARQNTQSGMLMSKTVSSNLPRGGRSLREDVSGLQV